MADGAQCPRPPTAGLPRTSPSSSARSRSSSSSRWRCRSTSSRRPQACQQPFIDWSRDRPRARLRPLHADPDAGAGLRRALQPGGHRGADRDPRRSSRSTPRSTSSSSSPARTLGALATKAFLSDEGERGATTARSRSRRDSTARSSGPASVVEADRHVLPGLGDRRRGGQPARRPRTGPRFVIGGTLGLARDGLRPAHRRRLQPGARVRARRSSPASGAASTTSCSPTCSRR